ncbi:MAG: 8-oxo-dGTP diphosphatase MutT [Rickettsiales bacterium]|nr:8-oxo-dGTP diphosphatase MutT [Rickettsiales bacterium]
MKQVLVSAVALIDQDNRILLAQRPEGKKLAGMWEFPGGKVEPDETAEQALRREIKEELGIDLCDSCLSEFNFVSHDYDDFSLLMLLYLCRKWEGIPQGKEGQALTWKFAHEMNELPMPPADKPLVAALRDYFADQSLVA